MRLRLTAEQEAKLSQLASDAGTLPEQLAADVVGRYLEVETQFFAAVELGIAAAESGELIDEAEMKNRIELMFNR
jgi:predicted transcriptional regulator